MALALSACTPQRVPTPPPATPITTLTTPTPAPTASPSLTATPRTGDPARMPSAAPASWADWTRFAQALRASTQADLMAAQPPLHYQLEIRLDLEHRRITGQEWIHFTNNSPGPLAELPLRLYPNLGRSEIVLSIKRLLIAGAADVGEPATSSVESPSRAVPPRLLAENSAVVATLAQPLAPGASLGLYVEFEARLPDEGGGNYSTFGYAAGVLALAQFYPTVPRIGSAGWDLETPPLFGDMTTADPALYDVWVTAPTGMTLVATGVTAAVTDNRDGTTTSYFVGGPQREFNLVASRDFEVKSRQVGDVTINSYYAPGHEPGGQAVLDWASEAFSIYQAAFGAYPYTELDIAATPTDAGGVEYPGLVVIADRMYDQAGERGSFFEIAVVHEVAHQWWYNLVGDDQVREPWLDEAVTQYATVLYYDARYGADGRAGIVKSFNDRWNRVKSTNDQPIGLPVASYEGGAYGAIVYGKGPLFLLALRERMGADLFARFLKDYSAAYRWRTATTQDFWNAAETSCACQLDDLFTQWVTARLSDSTELVAGSPKSPP